MWQSIKNIYHLGVAILANIYFGFPAKKLIVIGVTGTDGKTTTVNMIYEILKKAGKQVSMVSTINAVIAGKNYDTGFHVSSPAPFTVQKFAKTSVDNKDDFLVLEVTSHALDQYRFWGIDFAIGVITNITHDHLDYHNTWEHYFNTKAKLIKNVKTAILNIDEEQNFAKLVKKTSGRVISFGFSENANFNPKNFPIKLKMLGDYNVLNALASVAVCSILSVNESVIRSVLAQFSNLKGRMEEVKSKRSLKIIIDFASTANSLKQALLTLKKQTKGRLIAVFGSAGKRDIKKRSLMAETSVKLADITVITAEDPRGDWEIIKKQMTDAALAAGGKMDKNLFVIDRRDKAVDFTINTLAKSGDTIGFFGKGHEKSMNYDGEKEEHYDEFEEAGKALGEVNS